MNYYSCFIIDRSINYNLFAGNVTINYIVYYYIIGDSDIQLIYFNILVNSFARPHYVQDGTQNIPYT